MEIQNKPFSAWPTDFQEKLRRLSNTGGEIDGSGMVDLTYSYAHLDTFVALIDGEPIGWSLYHSEFYHYRNVVMVFVAERYRKRGVGSKLVRMVINKHGECNGFIWDKTSALFYRSPTMRDVDFYNQWTRGVA